MYPQQINANNISLATFSSNERCNNTLVSNAIETFLSNLSIIYLINSYFNFFGSQLDNNNFAGKEIPASFKNMSKLLKL